MASERVKFTVGLFVASGIAIALAAVVWLGLSHIIGTIVSKILLTVVFFVIVVPVATARRLMSKDTLQLRKFKKGTESVMKMRDHVFASVDIEKPY